MFSLSLCFMELEEGRTLKFYSSAKRKTRENPFIFYMSNPKTHGNSSNSGVAKRKKMKRQKGRSIKLLLSSSLHYQRLNFIYFRVDLLSMRPKPSKFLANMWSIVKTLTSSMADIERKHAKCRHSEEKKNKNKHWKFRKFETMKWRKNEAVPL